MGLAFARRLLLHRRHARRRGFALAGRRWLLAVGAAWPMLARAGVPWLQRFWLTWPEPVRWLADARTSMLACVPADAVGGVGPGSLIYWRRQGRPGRPLRGGRDRRRHVHRQDSLRRRADPPAAATINFIGVFIGAWLHAGGHILAMTGGAAGTEVAELHIFYKAFVFLQFGPATAMAWVLVRC
jgi:hypothetical protein